MGDGGGTVIDKQFIEDVVFPILGIALVSILIIAFFFGATKIWNESGPEIITIRGCEYVYPDNRRSEVIHAGDCSNPIHRGKQP